MAYYDRHYYGDQTRRGMNVPRLGLVGKCLLGLVGGGYLALTFATSKVDIYPAAFGDETLWIHQLVLTPSALLPIEDAGVAPWQVLTAPLVQQSLIGAIMICVVGIWLIGGMVEQVLGARRYLILVAASAITGNILAALIDPFLSSERVISMGFSPVLTTLLIMQAALYPDQRTILGIRQSTLCYVLIGIFAVMALNTYFMESATPGIRIVQSLPAMIGAGTWALFHARYVRSQGIRPASATPESENEDFLAYARQFVLEKESAKPKITTRRMKRAHLRKERDQQDVDRLLDRIAREGISSISRAERAFLERVSREKREKH